MADKAPHQTDTTTLATDKQLKEVEAQARSNLHSLCLYPEVIYIINRLHVVEALLRERVA